MRWTAEAATSPNAPRILEEFAGVKYCRVDRHSRNHQLESRMHQQERRETSACQYEHKQEDGCGMKLAHRPGPARQSVALPIAVVVENITETKAADGEYQQPEIWRDASSGCGLRSRIDKKRSVSSGGSFDGAHSVHRTIRAGVIAGNLPKTTAVLRQNPVDRYPRARPVSRLCGGDFPGKGRDMILHVNNGDSGCHKGHVDTGVGRPSWSSLAVGSVSSDRSNRPYSGNGTTRTRSGALMEAIDSHAGEYCKSLPPDEVHIWYARRPSSPLPELEATLSGGECDRARRFKFAKHRLIYLFAHAVLRDILSRYLQLSPGDVCFGENAFGKPFLDGIDAGRAPQFNLSHAGGLVLVGVCRGRRIGIDVEESRPIDDIAAIAESYFTPQECAFIFRQEPANRERAFFRCWTRKEAYVKAVGNGLSIPLHSFDTLISTGQSGGLLNSGVGIPAGTTWELADLDPDEGYVAAVAVETCINRLVHIEWRTSIIERLER